jgi:hypothetical protein
MILGDFFVYDRLLCFFCDCDNPAFGIFEGKFPHPIELFLQGGTVILARLF